MNRIIRLFATGCAFTSPLAALAAGPFLTLEAGPTFASDTQVREFFSAPPGSKMEFDPGFRFTVSGGFAFSDFCAIGGETGFSFNRIEDIAGTNITSESDSTIGHVPMVANIIFRLPNPTRVVPFAGAGAGLAFVWLDSHTIRDASGLVLDGSDSDALFAWQVFGGVKYELNDVMAIGLSYKYFHADSPNWRAEDVSGIEFNFGTGHIETHSVSFVFTMKF